MRRLGRRRVVAGAGLPPNGGSHEMVCGSRCMEGVMLRKVLAGLVMCGVTATLVLAQAPASPQPPAAGQGRGAGAGEGGRQGGAGGRGGTYLPTEEQWAAMSPKAKEYVDKARTIAGDDP